MGYEIKNICTLVPNPYHPLAGKDDYYYFSVFITPKLQFDGTLKEFYEMLYWPQYCHYLNEHCYLEQRNVLPENAPVSRVACMPDDSLRKGPPAIPIERRGAIWSKLFPADMPVEAWPLGLSPEETDKSAHKLAVLKTELDGLIKQSAALAIQETAAQAKTVIIQPSSPPGVNISADRVSGGGTPRKSADQDELEHRIGKKRQQLQAEKKKSQAAFHARKRFNQEFHKKVSALARYPHVLRLLGLIHDYKVPKSAFNRADLLVRFHVDTEEILQDSHGDRQVAEFLKSEAFIYPFTRCSVAGDRLSAYSTEDYTKVVQCGFVLPLAGTSGAFRVDQEYYEDGAAQFGQPQTGGDTIGFNGKIFEPDDVALLRQVVGQASASSKGLSIKVSALNSALLTSMDDEIGQFTEKTLSKGKDYFVAHHLDCGYRVDVRRVPLSGSPRSFSSLCLRRADYIVNWISGPFTILRQFIDEPWLEEVRQVQNEQDIQRFEEISRWNNWSLSCPAFEADTSDKSGIYNDMELQNVLPVGLAPLQFGETYQFRIRTVDICGNGRACQTDQETSDRFLLFEASYCRNEALQPPLFFPTTLLFDEKENKVDLDHKGEDSQTLVIRAKVDEKGAVGSGVQTCNRYLTPVHVTMNYAQMSKSLDPSVRAQASELFELIQQYPQPYYPESKIQQGIPFLYDTAVSGFVVKDVQTDKENTLALSGGKPVQITLTNSGGPSASVFALKPGDFKKLLIRSAGTVNGDKVESMEKECLLVHAVQKPFRLEGPLPIEGDVIQMSKQLRFNRPKDLVAAGASGKYQVELYPGDDDGKFNFPMRTTGELVLHVAYREYELNKNSPTGWSYVSTKYKGKDALYERAKADQADNFSIRKSFINTKSESRGLETVCSSECSLGDFYKAVREAFSHSFPRPGYYQDVSYRLEGISKYVSYFDLTHHWFSADQIDGGEKKTPFSIFGNLDPMPVYNAVKPSKPLIGSIVPLFITSQKGSTYTFEHEAFRVYLGPVWFETGLEESLAVVYRQKNPQQELYPDKITIIGTDPTAMQQKAPIVNPASKYPWFFEGHDGLDKEPAERKLVDSVLFSADKPNADYPKGAKAPSDYTFSKFEVRWDAGTDQFYADILLENTEHFPYSALMSFTVCRYQPNSVVKPLAYDFRFSDLVKTDLVSRRPKRKITVEGGRVRLDLMQEPGGRNFLEKGDAVRFAPNRYFLVVESGPLSKELTDIKKECKVFEISPEGELIGDGGKPSGQTFNLASQAGKGAKVFLEEYEAMKLSDSFHPEKKAYNPRNDPQMRLVFFHQIR